MPKISAAERARLRDSSFAYVGLSVHTVARICAVAGGGQILVSDRTRDALGGALPEGSRVRSAGIHTLRAIRGEHRLYEVAPARA